jgi:IS30 family transposase
MARKLKMAEVTTIRTLHASGHSNREIARLLGVHRDTVGRYVAAGDADPAKPDHRVDAKQEPPNS